MDGIVFEMLTIWWAFWTLTEVALLIPRWRRYVQLYMLTCHFKQRWMLYVMVLIYIPISPALKLWEVFKPLFVVHPYRLQVEIFRYDGRNGKANSDLAKISDGSAIAISLMEGDSSISHIYYQVVRVYDAMVLEADRCNGSRPSR